MVTVDPTGGDVIDYSDFQTQMVRAFAFYEPSAPTSPPERDGIIGLHTIEPLAGIGGLSNNEVAELMYLQVDATLDARDDIDDQNLATTVDLSGVVGINLNSQNDFVRSSTTRGNSEILEQVGSVSIPTGAVGSPTVTDNDRLEMFEAFMGPPFDDQSGGTGGSYVTVPYHSEKYYRQTHGRGPVLDQNDDVSILFETAADDATFPIEAEVRLTMYWDIAETSDAGRRFSVPRGL